MIAGLLLLSVALTRGAADTGSIRDIPVAAGEVLRTTSTGSGEPLVLVPGLFGSAYGYRSIVALLVEQGYRTIVIEPLGTGWSSYPSKADYSLTAQADRIAAAMDSLGLRHVLVVAHAVGTSMALRLAFRHPERVRGLVSIEGGPDESAATPGLRKAMRFAGLLKLFVGQGTIRRKVRQGMIANSGDTTWVTPEVVQGYVKGPGRHMGTTIDAFHRMARSHEPEQLADHLTEIRAPIWLLVGAAPHETAVGDDEIALLRHRVARFRVDSVRGSGQYIHEEQPAAVVRAVRALDAAAR